MAVVHRVTARVVPVSRTGEVLLLQDQDPAEPGLLRWGTIGGAVEPGESLVDAALREMREETGILAEPGLLGPEFHHDSGEFAWNGVSYTYDSTFFTIRLESDVAVTFEHLEPAEVGNVLAARWWLPDDLEIDGTAVVPYLPDILRAAVTAASATEGHQ
ncbi:MAG: NUDIX domain-containing protein [Nocardioides sp.]